MSSRSLAAIITVLCFCCPGCARRQRGNNTCPEVDQCACDVTPKGPRVRCSNVPNPSALPRGLSRLQGHVIRTLSVRFAKMDVLPGYIFTNITVRVLEVEHCGLKSIDDNALFGLEPLKTLDLSNNFLTSIPSALRALTAVNQLYLVNNRVQHVGEGLAHLSSSLHSLSLERNLISSFHTDAFKNLTRLRKLWLRRNRIQSIPPTLLLDVPALVLLDLQWNAIESPSKHVFRNLGNLQELILTKNNITNIYGLTTAMLPSLRKLSLDYNPVTAVTVFGSVAIHVEEIALQNCNVSLVNPIAFGSLERLRTINISNNNISFINGAAFHKRSKLIKFAASHNAITSLEGTFSTTRLLERVQLSSNRITDITKAFTITKFLKEVKMKRNLISFLADNTFENNRNLEHLDLEDNQISWLGKDCFRGLVSLRTLFLGSNWVVTLNGSLHLMPTLQHLYLQRNLLQKLEEDDFKSVPNLKKVFAYANNVTDVRGAFKQLPRLEALFLQNNSLATVHRAGFHETTMSLKTINVAGNPLNCDCQIAWLLEDDAKRTLQSYPVCQSPQWLEGSLLQNITSTALQDWPQDCDKRCTCTCHVNIDYSKVTVVDCKGKGLTHAPEQVPRDTYAINLEQNGLRAMGNFFGNNTPHLHTLLLRDNSLKNIEGVEIPKGLKSLDLRNNSLTRLPTGIVSQLNLSSLWLSGNPWICDCDAYDFQLWVTNEENVLKDSVVCSDGSNPSAIGKPLMTLEQKDLCPIAVSKFVLYGVPVFAVLTLVLITTVVYLKRERQIKIWLYAHGLRCVKEYELDSDKVFDVFLSFSSKDFDWVHENLIPGLEKADFLVCTYDRNFKGGFLLQDIIREAVSCSRRTLLLLTPNFVDSEWCRWEFRVAHHTALQDKINRLIVVVVDEVPEGLDEELVHYMQATNYLRWGERHFWNKLIYSLPKKDKNSVGDAGSTPLRVIHKAGG